MLITDLPVSRNYFPRREERSKGKGDEQQQGGGKMDEKDGGNLRVEAFLARDNGEYIHNAVFLLRTTNRQWS